MGFRDFITFFTVFELYYYVVIIPLFILLTVLQNVPKLIPRSPLDDGTYFTIFNIVYPISLMFGFFIFELIKR